MRNLSIDVLDNWIDLAICINWIYIGNTRCKSLILYLNQPSIYYVPQERKKECLMSDHIEEETWRMISFLCLKYLLINIEDHWLLIVNNFQQRYKQSTLFILLISLRPWPLSYKGEKITFQDVVINFLLSMLLDHTKLLMQESTLVRILIGHSKILRLYRSMSCMSD